MNCPRCENELAEATKQGVVIDPWPSCGGIWLDKGELGKIISQMKKTEASLEGEFRSARMELKDYHDRDYDKGPYDKNQYKRKSRFGNLFDIFD